MDFNEAIRVHAGWKMKLQQYLTNPDGSINPTDLAKDNLCDLGKWLHGEGRIYAKHPEYAQLVQEHQSFHKAASEIVSRKHKGEEVKQDTALGGSSPFSRCSSQVVSLLMKMRSFVKS